MDSPNSFAWFYLRSFNVMNTFLTPLIIYYICSINSDTDTQLDLIAQQIANEEFVNDSIIGFIVHSACMTWEDFQTHQKMNCDEEINQAKTHKSKYIWRCIHHSLAYLRYFGLVKIHKAQHHRSWNGTARNSYDNNKQINSHEHVYSIHTAIRSTCQSIELSELSWAEPPLHSNANSIDLNLLLDHKISTNTPHWRKRTPKLHSIKFIAHIHNSAVAYVAFFLHIKSVLSMLKINFVLASFEAEIKIA